MESTITKKSGKLTTISIPMPPGQYGAMHIAQWSASVASCKATRCCHQASARAVLPWQMPCVLSHLLALRNTVSLLQVGASYQKVVKSEL
jgi:hypothetical protein